MPKRNPDDDARTLDAMARASQWMMSIWAGRDHGYFRAPFNSLDEARTAGRMAEDRIGNGRAAMAYAITPDGASVFIPRDLDEIYHQQQGAHHADTPAKPEPGPARKRGRAADPRHPSRIVR